MIEQWYYDRSWEGGGHKLAREATAEHGDDQAGVGELTDFD